jgi:hypothetical protein
MNAIPEYREATYRGISISKPLNHGSTDAGEIRLRELIRRRMIYDLLTSDNTCGHQYRVSVSARRHVRECQIPSDSSGLTVL